MGVLADREPGVAEISKKMIHMGMHRFSSIVESSTATQRTQEGSMPEKSRVAGLARRPDMAGTVRRLLRLILVVVLLVGASQGTTLAAPASWNYVALGDSLATGFGAFKGYVSRYEAYIETDTGVAVTRTNLGQNR
jgi:hypothetical protein